MTAKRRDAVFQPGFLGWLRDNPRLDSVKNGLVVSDSDAWIHRYKTVQGREYQFMMLLEIKEYGALLNTSQRDTLHIANQLLRNRRNKTSYQPSGHPRICKVYSIASKREVYVICFGVHSVTICGDGREAHLHKLIWDSKLEISVEQLEDLLMFEIDPDDLSRLDHRPCGHGARHKKTIYVKEVEMPLGFSVDKPFVTKS